MHLIDYALLNVMEQLTDICVKNAGFRFLVEVASRDFVDALLQIARSHVSF